MDDRQNLFRSLPQVDEVLQNPQIAQLCNEYPREVLVNKVRLEIAHLRTRILNGESCTVDEIKPMIIDSVVSSIRGDDVPSLIPVINATGVTIHTNLGRSILCDRAIKEVRKTSENYSNLEYDLEEGSRGSRHVHVEKLITEITGAEAAMVVNNNAAATLLVLSAIGKDREIVTSRGELVEIGGSFRVPEIMEQGGAILKEVGTTNRTRKKDYIRAFKQDKTAAFLKVHTSNYKIVGFTEEVALDEMVCLAHERNIPAIYDMGSGLFCDLSRHGIDEPVVPKVLATGVDVVLFSGDKLLGGPQAGIIVGKKEYIDLFKSHPLARALRVDKMTISALCGTLYEYKDSKTALTRIPTLRMLTYSKDELLDKANKLADTLKTNTPYTINIEECEDQVGGGSAPGTLLNGYMVSVSGLNVSAETAENNLRKFKVPVLCRISHDNICFSVRTIQEGQNELIVEAVKTL